MQHLLEVRQRLEGVARHIGLGQELHNRLRELRGTCESTGNRRGSIGASAPRAKDSNHSSVIVETSMHVDVVLHTRPPA